MEKMIIDERTSWEYEPIGEQYNPTGRVLKNGAMTPSELPDDNDPGEEKRIDIWGRRHLQYILQHKKSLYFDLYVSGKLNTYLADVNAHAENMFFRLIKEIASREGVTESLKAENQMVWVQKMNSIKNQATETVNIELIFVYFSLQVRNII